MSKSNSKCGHEESQRVKVALLGAGLIQKQTMFLVPPDVPIYGWLAPAASLLLLIVSVKASAEGESRGPCSAQTLTCCLAKQICH